MEEYEKLLTIENQFLFLNYEPPEYLREQMDKVWRNSTEVQREEYIKMAVRFNDELDRMKEPEWWTKTLKYCAKEHCLIEDYFNKQKELPSSLRSGAAFFMSL